MSKGDIELANVEVFNLVAAAVLARLYESFPIPRMLSGHLIAVELLGEEKFFHPEGLRDVAGFGSKTDEGSRYEQIANRGIEWLEATGFMVRAQGASAHVHHVLTPKGFEALAAIPSSVAGKERKSLGQQLTKAARTAGDRTSSAIISDIVGQVIGAAARSFMGS